MVLRGEEEEPDHRAQVQERGRRRHRLRRRLREQAQRHDRLGGPALVDDQRPAARRQQRRAAARPGSVQPRSADSMIPNTSAPTPSVALSAPTRSKRPAVAASPGRNRGASDDHRDADRYVDEEPGPPRDPWSASTADDQAEARADAGGRRVPGHRPGALAAPPGSYAVSSDEGRRRDDRRSDALEGAGGDQPPARSVRVRSAATRARTRPARTTNTRRRPSRSPARAPSSSRPPKTSVYASWTQDRPVAAARSRSSACWAAR